MRISKRMRAGLVVAGLGTALAVALTTAANAGEGSDGTASPVPGRGTGVPATFCPHALKMVKRDATLLADDGTGLRELKPGDRARAVPVLPGTDADATRIAPEGTAGSAPEAGTSESGTQPGDRARAVPALPAAPGADAGESRVGPQGTAESGTTEEVTPRRVLPGQVAGQSGATEDVTPRRVIPGQAPGRSGATEKTTPEGGTTEKGTAGHDAPITVEMTCPSPSLAVGDVGG